WCSSRDRPGLATNYRRPSRTLARLLRHSRLRTARSCDVTVLEMGEDQGCPGDVADLAGAEGDVLECPPAAGEQGEAAFAQAAQGALQGVAGTGADIELGTTGRIAQRDVDADARALVAGIGQG